jgi:hypothetical protein
MPGLGAVLTFTLIALLPELGKMSRKQTAVLPLEGISNMAANARRVVTSTLALRCRKGATTPSLDYLVGECEKRRRNVQL